jgi:GrpB-like predicted nucleotidyltransferase (UPF0157 family)
LLGLKKAYYRKQIMTVPNAWTALVGNWTGLNRLWLSPDEPVRESETTATVALIAEEKFLTFRYTWADEDQPQEGFLLIGQEGDENIVQAFWIDSWHMRDTIMPCQGSLDAQGSLSVQGSYAVPTGPDWGWRIIIEPGEGNTLRLVMVNINPDGKEALAVEARYWRAMRVEIVPYRDSWPLEFQTIATTLRQGLGEKALRIDHIGSTSVAGLAAKDVIDIQITVATLDQGLLSAMQVLGYTQPEGIWRDHRPAGVEGPETEWDKWYFRPPAGQRRTHTHVRVVGRLNQRYPLLFRDYLRAHPATAESYAELKRRLAQSLADPLTYPGVKDPAVDLIYLAAEEWAAATHWQPGPPDV